MKQSVTIPIDLLVAINYLCTYVESKILLATMCYNKGVPTSTQIRKMTGITQPNNYFRTRKQLLDIGYLIIGDDGMRINADAILNDYKEEYLC